MSDVVQALAWITGVFRGANVPFQVVGGLAARAYGANRPLVDLDFYAPTSQLVTIAKATQTLVVRPPLPYRDDSWDLAFMKLVFHGQAIEIGGADGARYFDRAAGTWRDADIRFSDSVERRLFGILVPVMPRDQLIEYKRRLDRDVDRRDIAGMLEANPSDDA